MSDRDRDWSMICNKTLIIMQGDRPFSISPLTFCHLQKDSRTRYPDLVLLCPEHLPLIERWLTITPDMPPPQLVIEIVSPGQVNRQRDYEHKRRQYEQRGIPEFWLLDPEPQTICVLHLQSGPYAELGTFQGNDVIRSATLAKFNLPLTPAQGFDL
jgi:Uma2 family endonuclease